MRSFVAASLGLALVSVAVPARADGPFEGDYRSGTRTMDVSVTNWGTDCGPRPQASTSAGGNVHITQSGDHLTIGRRTTRGCWSDNPAVRLVTSSVESGAWRIVCRTPTDDPRRETGTYTLRASGTERLEFRDVTQYDWQLNESHCEATMTVTQTFERVGGAVATPTPTPTPTPAAPEEPACTPGAPARLALRPARQDVEPGVRACVTARVVDAAGCWVRSESASLSIDSTSFGTLRGNCVETSASGDIVITARGAGFEERATISVHTIDLTGLTAARTNDGTAPDDATATSEAESGIAASTVVAGRRTPIWLIALAGVGLLVTLGAVVGLLTRKKKTPARPRTSMASPAPAPLNEAPAEPAEALICPMCRRTYPGETICPKDHEPLVPYATFAAKKAEAQRVCPSCGTSYASHIEFCGKDGTPLPPPRA